MSRYGWRDNRWHPSYVYEDFVKWRDSEEGKSIMERRSNTDKRRIKEEADRTNPINHNIDYNKIMNDPKSWAGVPEIAKPHYKRFAKIQAEYNEGSLTKNTKRKKTK